MKRNTILILLQLLSVTLLLLHIESKKIKTENISPDEELYKNVLPYIKQVANDAARTKQLIHETSKTTKAKKIKTKKKLDKETMLKELDNKVLPWLSELTSKVNGIAEGKASLLKAQLKKVHHEIKGPTALNSDTDFQLGNQDVSGPHLKQQQLPNILTTEGQQKQDASLTKPDTPNLHEFDSQNKSQTNKAPETTYKAQGTSYEAPATEKEDKDVESEVAQLTNQIAEFQQEIDGMPENSADDSDMTDTDNTFTREYHGSAKKKKKTKNKNQKEKKNKAVNSGSVKIIFGGNIGFDGIVRYKVEQHVCTYNESFDRIKKFLHKADHVVMNLDTAFGIAKESNRVDPEKSDNKIADNAAAESFSYAGIDTVVLANDHILDYGPEAATYTAELLRQNNVLFSGLSIGRKTFNRQEPVIYATNGVAIGMLSYCANYEGCRKIRNQTAAGPAVYNSKLAIDEVTALRESGIDIVIVYMHWGNEENLTSSIEIKHIVRNITDVKVDVLVGSHPHVEGHYFYRGTLVVFSLGNFLTPMHVHVYKSIPGSNKSAKMLDKLWYKQSQRMEVPSLYSKLLQIEVNRDGLIPFKAKYLPIRIGLTENHCLQPERVPDQWWISICTRRDKQCLGTSKCNELECDGRGIL